MNKKRKTPIIYDAELSKYDNVIKNTLQKPGYVQFLAPEH